MDYVGGFDFKMFLATSVAHMSVSHIKDTDHIKQHTKDYRYCLPLTWMQSSIKLQKGKLEMSCDETKNSRDFLQCKKIIFFDKKSSVFTLHCFASVWPGLVKRGKATALLDSAKRVRLVDSNVCLKVRTSAVSHKPC